MKFFVTIFLVSLASFSWASKDGMYVSAGISTNTYRSNDSNSFVSVVEDERATGWRGEVGHIWDLGKPGGFQMGVSGAYDRFGEVSGNGRFGTSSGDVSLDAGAFSAYFVIDQELAQWVDFVFKIGPSRVEFKAESCCNLLGRDAIDERETRWGSSAVIGFVFFPTENIGIELAAQATSWFTGDLRDIEVEDDFYDFVDTRVVARSFSANFQYRF